MFVYFSVFSLLCFLGLSYTPEQHRRLLYGCLYVFFVIFVGARLDTGCDFTGYLNRFTYIDTGQRLGDVTAVAEPGYYVFTYVIKKLGLDYVWVNVFAAAIFFYFLLVFCRNHPRSLLLIAIMFPILVIQLSMSGVRQALATAFFMGALDAFMREKRLFVVTYILLGATFHQSLIITLPIVLMMGREFSMSRIMGALIVLMPVSAMLLGERGEVYQTRYIDGDSGSMRSFGAIFRLGILVIVSTLFELNRDGVKALFPKEYNLMRLFALASFLLVPLMVVNTVLVHRLGYYMMPMQLFTAAALPAVLAPNFKNWRAYEVFGPVALFAAYILVWFSLSRHAQLCYVPYQSYIL